MVFTFILVAFLLITNNKVSQVETEQLIAKLSEKSKYELIQYRKGKAIKLSSGYLGKFYHCLKSYKSSSYKKPRKGESEPAYYLVLDNLPILQLKVSSQEAYLFSPEVDDFTGIFAINCELSLLNSRS